mmetsp:Transcript_17393/g.38502  ORF Transcript_17393/g.38502 Transcript_17393/m.38502 type:complete len:243 (+) Transcript_17393:630-1358(+)
MTARESPALATTSVRPTMTAQTAVHPAWTGWSGRLHIFLPFCTLVGTDADGATGPVGGLRSCSLVGTTISPLASPPPGAAAESAAESAASSGSTAGAAPEASAAPSSPSSSSPFMCSSFWKRATASFAERTIVPCSPSSPVADAAAAGSSSSESSRMVPSAHSFDRPSTASWNSSPSSSPSAAASPFASAVPSASAAPASASSCTCTLSSFASATPSSSSSSSRKDRRGAGCAEEKRQIRDS